MPSPRGHRAAAIVVRALDFAETSQIVHLVTEGGLVSALAKGAHAPKGAFQGGVALGVLGEADLLARRGAELELLRSFRVTDGLRGLRDDLARFAAGGAVLAALRTLSKPGLPNEGLFRAGVTALKAISTTSPGLASTWVLVFEARALLSGGHRPELHVCVACGAEVGAEAGAEVVAEAETDGGAAFAPQAGGVLHRRCGAPGPRRPLSAADLAALRRVHGDRWASFVEAPLSPAAVRAVRAVHDLFLPYTHA